MTEPPVSTAESRAVAGGLRQRGHPIGWIEEAVMLGERRFAERL
jgi:hypothetical protein